VRGPRSTTRTTNDVQRLAGVVVRLTFEAPELEPTSAPAPHDLLLGVVGTVRPVADDGHVTYEEVLVPIVELALALDDWLRDGVDQGVDFAYDSVESDVPDLLWCRRTSGGWLVGSPDQTAPDLSVHPTQAVVEPFSDFVRSVDVWLGRELGRRLTEAR
jgi:hypothetical protein